MEVDNTINNNNRHQRFLRRSRSKEMSETYNNNINFLKKRKSQDENGNKIVGKLRKVSAVDNDIEASPTKTSSSLHVRWIGQEKEITTVKEWQNVLAGRVPVQADNHVETLYMRFSYMYAQRAAKYLMVTDSGEVTVTGKADDERSYFTLYRNIENSHFQLVCMGGAYRDHMLYIDDSNGYNLKVKPCTNKGFNGNTSISGVFTFSLMSDSSAAGELVSVYTNQPLQFDNKGMYVPYKTTSPVEHPFFIEKELKKQDVVTKCRASYRQYQLETSV